MRYRPGFIDTSWLHSIRPGTPGTLPDRRVSLQHQRALGLRHRQPQSVCGACRHSGSGHWHGGLCVLGACLLLSAPIACSLAAALVGLSFSLYLAHVEAHILGVWCIYCVASLAVISLLTLLSLGTIVVSRTAVRIRYIRLKSALRIDLNYENNPGTICFLGRHTCFRGFAQDSVNPALRPPKGAQIAIVVFEDLQCPQCRRAGSRRRASGQNL